MKSMLKWVTRLLTIGTVAFSATAAQAMNNQDVIKMVSAKLAEDTILLAVRTAEIAEFDTSATALVELKEKNVSDSIIQAVIKRAGSGAAGGGADLGGGKLEFTKVPDNEVLPPQVDLVPGQEYFTRYSFKFERGERLATNYWRGGFVPINTRVTYIGATGKNFTIRIADSGAVVKIENVPKYTQRDVAQLARELLSATPTPIEKYGEETARQIRSGELRLGMTKTQVLLTRGYPPSHETSSLDADAWKYWSSRFIVQTLVFDHGILVEGRGLR